MNISNTLVSDIECLIKLAKKLRVLKANTLRFDLNHRIEKRVFFPLPTNYEGSKNLISRLPNRQKTSFLIIEHFFSILVHCAAPPNSYDNLQLSAICTVNVQLTIKYWVVTVNVQIIFVKYRKFSWNLLEKILDFRLFELQSDFGEIPPIYWFFNFSVLFITKSIFWLFWSFNNW